MKLNALAIILQFLILTASMTFATSALALRNEPLNDMTIDADGGDGAVVSPKATNVSGPAESATPAPAPVATPAPAAVVTVAPSVVSKIAAPTASTPVPVTPVAVVDPAFTAATNDGSAPTASAVTGVATAPAISQAALISMLNNPKSATAARYGIQDSAGNYMQSASIIQMSGQSAPYAAVYHTPYQVAGGYRFKLNLATSKDLVNWTFVRMLVDNADMPKLVNVADSQWVMLVHEQWMGKAEASSGACQVKYELFYNAADLLSGSIRSSYLQPAFGGNLNGTPSVYDAHMIKRGDFYVVDGTFGFHYWSGVRDLNASATITNLFQPKGGTSTSSKSLDDYNVLLIKSGVSGNIGQRDTLQTSTGRYNLQEGNVGTPGASWDAWRMWLYTFNDTQAGPSGKGSVIQLAPQTPNGSRSFGNPSVQIVNSPSGHGQSLVVTYFLFSEGAGAGEGGGMLYYYDLPN